MNRNTNALGLAIAATLGAGAAQAATTTVTLVQYATYSNNGSSAANISSSTATWQYDDVTGLVTQTGGTLNARFTTAPTSTLFRHTSTGLVIGASGPASATTWSCLEGNFGGGVGASICGNYNFGANFLDESTLTYSGSSVTRVLGGDDGSIGTPQSVADLNNMAVTVSGTSLVLTNAVCTLSPAANCTTITGNPTVNKGLSLQFQLPVPTDAVDDAASTHLNTPTVIDVLANDAGLDPAANKTTVSITTPPADGGTAVITNDGATASSVCADPCTDTLGNIRIKYTPNKPLGTATYTESFGYTVTNVTTGSFDGAFVSVTVNNAVPVAGNNTLTISTEGVAPQTTSASFNAGTLAGNSLGDAPAVVTKTDGTKGTVAVSGNTVTYTPSATFFSGSDTFTYTITDADTEAATGTVTVNIPDLTPSLDDDTATTTAGTAVDVDLLGDLASPGNGSLAQHTFGLGPIVAIATGGATDGTCAITGTVLTYTPNAGFTGTDTCSVYVEDADGSVDPAVVTITVNSAAPPFSSTGLREDDGGSALDWAILSLFGGAALARRRRRAS